MGATIDFLRSKDSSRITEQRLIGLFLVSIASLFAKRYLQRSPENQSHIG